ncbi:MAG TPA: four helix bundle protein [Pyrinomonadaceae bacterium]|jgi:four helix bundle protein|nr:four helix bundle protein [Pyrinomonadaceae bacterium]
MNDERGTSDARTKFDLRLRTRAFALRIVKLYTSLPKTAEAQVLGKQLLRSGTSVGAHYHEATRSRSSAEFISKIEAGLQELEESVYWINLLIDCGIARKEKLTGLCQEADELAAILVASVKTVKRRR